MVAVVERPLVGLEDVLKTSSSRAGEKTSVPWSFLTLPISAARAARSLTSLRICRSSLSIWCGGASGRRPTLGRYGVGPISVLRVMEGLVAGVDARFLRQSSRGANGCQRTDSRKSALFLSAIADFRTGCDVRLPYLAASCRAISTGCQIGSRSIMCH